MVDTTGHDFDTQEIQKAVDLLIEQANDEPGYEGIADDFLDQWEDDYDIYVGDFDDKLDELVSQFANTSNIPDFNSRFSELVNAHPLQGVIREILRRNNTPRTRIGPSSRERREWERNREALQDLQVMFVLAWKKTRVGAFWKSIVYNRSLLGSLMFYHHVFLKTPVQQMPGFFQDPDHPDHDYQTFIRDFKEVREQRRRERRKNRGDDRQGYRDGSRRGYPSRDRDQRRSQDTDRQGYRSRDDDRF